MLDWATTVMEFLNYYKHNSTFLERLQSKNEYRLLTYDFDSEDEPACGVWYTDIHPTEMLEKMMEERDPKYVALINQPKMILCVLDHELIEIKWCD